MIILLLLLLTQQPQPAKIHCAYELDGSLSCSYPEDQNTFPEGVNKADFTLHVPRVHVWQKYLKELQKGVSTVELEETWNTVCLVQTDTQNGWVRESPNAGRIADGCVKLQTLKRR